MPYIIPSSAITPGTVYQPAKGAPAYITANARAMACVKGGALSATHMLDQSPRNNGTRRTGEDGRCYTADGTDDEVNYGDIGSAIWFSGWVKLNSDDQCLFSLSNDTNTNLIVSSGVLTAGATLTLSAIKVDNVTKTASEAGALLNDNLWHFLSCGIGDGLGGASTADDVRYFTDGTNHGSVSGFDWRFWATAPTADELTEAYSGESTNRNSAALSKYALWSKMDEQSGTTSYDASGNDLTGTITNATLATFHATLDIWSFQNQVGFNTSGAVYIPRDESSPSNDVIGNSLTYTGRRPNDFKLTGSNCLTLNGTNQSVFFADTGVNEYVKKIYIRFYTATPIDRTTAGIYLLSFYSASVNYTGIALGSSTSSFTNEVISVLEISGRSAVENITISAGWHELEIVYNSPTSYSIILDGAEQTVSIVSSHARLNARQITIGSLLDNAARNYSGCLCDIKLYNDSDELIFHAPCAEGAGTQVLDVVGGRVGTIQNAVSNWASTQDVYHANLLDGFSLYEHASSDPIRVPFGEDGQPISYTPPTGYSKTSDNYPGDYHNGAESTIDFNPDSTPEMGATQLGITVPASHAFGDAFTASDQIFSRQRTLTEDRFVVMPEAQTGSALAIIQKYTQP